MARIAPNELLPIGDLARRAGISVPTVRYYEERGLIHSERTPGNKRLFPRTRCAGSPWWPRGSGWA